MTVTNNGSSDDFFTIIKKEIQSGKYKNIPEI